MKKQILSILLLSLLITDYINAQVSSGCPDDPITVTRVYQVTDDAGNTETCERIITIVDTQPPVVTCLPTQANLTCGMSIPPPVTSIADFIAAGGTVSDGCSSNADISISSTDSNSDGSGCGVNMQSITRTYTFTDACGNSSECIQNFVYEMDVTPPSIYCPYGITTMVCGQAVPNPYTSLSEFTYAGGTVTDDCSALSELSFVLLEKTTSGISCAGNPMIVSYKYEVRDACDNASHCVQKFQFEADNTPPSVICPPVNNSLTCGQSLPDAATDAASFIALGGSISDNCTSDDDFVISVIEETNNGTLGCAVGPYTVTRTYKIQDQCNNETTCSHVFQYQTDVTPPSVNCPPNNSSLTCGEPLPNAATDVTSFIALGGSVADDCSENAQLSVSVLSETDNGASGCTGDPYVVTRTYVVEDACGNSTTCNQLFEYNIDGQAPTITCPPNELNMACGEMPPLGLTNVSDFILSGGSIVDNCSNNADITVSFVDNFTVNDVCPNGTENIINRVYTITDACGNEAQCSQLFMYDNTMAELVIEKSLIGEPMLNADGTYDLIFGFFIQNTGNVVLDSLQLTDDLSSFVPVNTTSFSDISSNVSVNTAFNGIDDFNTLMGFDSLLPDETASFNLLVNVGPYLPYANIQYFANDATVQAIDPNGELIEEESAITVPLEMPEIGIFTEKTILDGPTLNIDGTYTVSFHIFVENTGDVLLDSLTLFDNLTNFQPVNEVTFLDHSSNLSLNTLYNGDIFNGHLLEGNNNMLYPDETAYVDFEINFGPFANTPASINNIITATGDDPTGIPVIDDEPELVPLTESNPSIGLAKALLASSYTNNGTVLLTFQFVVQNTGDVTLENLQLQDDLVAQFGPLGDAYFIPLTSLPQILNSTATQNPSVNSGFNGANNINFLTGNDGILQPGQGFSLVFTMEVDPLSVNMPTKNIAVVSGTDPANELVEDTSTNGFDPDKENDGPENNNEPTPVPLEGADLGIVKSSDALNETLMVGDTITYTITLTNYGPGEAGDIEVTDDLPYGLEFLSYQASEGNYNSATGLWTITQLVSGNFETLEITALVTENGSINNITSITNINTFDPNPTNNTDETLIIVEELIVDLSLTKLVNRDSVLIGDTVTYTIVVNNNGSDTATNIVVDDILPDEVLCVSSSDSSYDPYNGDFSWNIDALSVGETDTLEISVIATETGSVINTATITSVDQLDINLENNSDGKKVIVSDPMADLQLNKLSDLQVVEIGDSVTYNIIVNNLGPNNSETVEIVDYLPFGLQYLSNSTTEGFYNPGTGIWSLSSIDVNETDTLTLLALATEGGSIINNAAITYTETLDSNSGNNSDSVVITAQVPTADLGIFKESNVEEVVTNDTINYNIIVVNYGPNDVDYAEVLDNLPFGLTYLNSYSSSGPYNPTTGIWQINGLLAEEEAILDIRAIVNENGSIINTAQIVHSNLPDTNDKNNIDEAEIYSQEPMVDLDITKNVSSDTILVGDDFWYQITLTNNGPQDATNIQVVDNLPVGLTYNGHVAESGNYNVATGIWFVNLLEAGQSVTLTLDALGNQVGTFINTASIIELDQTDTNNNNNSDNVNVTVEEPMVDLAITKNVSSDTILVGDDFWYQITLTNNGPQDATNIQVVDNLPVGLTYNGHVAENGNYNVAMGIWFVNLLEAGQNVTLTLDALGNQVGTFINTASIIELDQTDTNPNNNSDNVDITVLQATADLSIIKESNTEETLPTDTITYSLTVTNYGPSNVDYAEVLDNLPFGTTYLNSFTPSGIYNPQTGIWQINGLAVGEETTLDIQVLVTENGTIINTAQIINSSLPDTNTTNNIDEVEVYSQEFFADLEIVKTTDVIGYTLGDTVTYILTLFNHGPDDATNVEVTDYLPEEVTYVSSSDNSYNPFTGDFTWNIGGPLAASGSVMMTIDVIANETGNILNMANITNSDQTDSNLANNTDGTTIIVEEPVIAPPTVDLELNKTVSSDTININEAFWYTITLTNNGPSTATNIEVVENLPIGLVYTGHIVTQGIYNIGTGLWSIDSLEAGESTTLTLDAKGIETGTFTNMASILSIDQEDTNPNNNSDQTNITVTQPTADLGIFKESDIEETAPGDTVTYNIIVVNYGPNDVDYAEVLDNLPFGVTYLNSYSPSGIYNPQTGIWQLNGLAVGEETTLDIQVLVTENGNIVNTAQIIYSNLPDTNNKNNIDEAEIYSQEPLVDLEIVKTTDTIGYTLGDTITYILTLFNNGPNEATNVEVTDYLPEEVTYVNSSDDSYNPFNGDFTWNIGGPLAASGSVMMTIDVIANETGNILNIASITDIDQTDSNEENNIDGTTIVVEEPIIEEPLIDLSITKTVSSDTVNIDEVFWYNITLTNNGPDTATNIEVIENLPPTLDYTGHIETKGIYSVATATWHVPTLLPNESAKLIIDAEGTEIGWAYNTVTILNADQEETDLSNNEAGAEVFIYQPSANLVLNKGIDTVCAYLGDTIIYTLTVSNYGPDTATNIGVSDYLPSQVTCVSSSDTSYAPYTGDAIWNIEGPLAVGESTELTIYTIANEVGGVYNQAAIEFSDQPDYNLENNISGIKSDIKALETDLAITKIVSTDTVEIGEPFWYEITLTNNGPNMATNIEVVENLPIGLDYTGHVATQGIYNTATDIWSIASLEVGESVTLTLDAQGIESGTFNNVVNILSLDQEDTNPNNNTDNVDITIPEPIEPVQLTADLGIFKESNIEETAPGDTVTYNIIVVNYGPNDVDYAEVLDNLPFGVTYLNSYSPSGIYNPQTGIWQLNGLTVGEETTLDIQVLVTENGSIVNTAQIIYSNLPDTNDKNNIDEAEIYSQEPLVDLEIVKTTDTIGYTLGDTITYILTLFNHGPNEATNVEVTDYLPEEVTYVSSSNDSYNPLSGDFTWNIGGPLAASGSVMMLIDVVANETGDILNIANISNSDQTDSNLANNIDGTTIFVEEPIIEEPLVDLAITKSVSSDTVGINEEFWYIITLTNNGPATATNIEVIENLPPALLYTGHIETQGIYSVANATWHIPSLAAGQSAKLIIDAEGTQVGWAYNTVTILSTDQEETDLTNNEAGAEVFIYQPYANLVINKGIDTACAYVGDTIIYTLTVSNYGPDPATNIGVSDYLPPQVTYVSSSDTSYTPYTGDAIWNIEGPLAVGESTELTIYTIANEIGGVYNQTVIEFSDQPDPNSENNIAGIKSDIKALETDLAIIKTVSKEEAEQGEAFTYFIELINNGPAIATNIEVVESLPSTIDYIGHNESNGVYNQLTGLWNLNSLEVGDTAFLMIDASSQITGNHTNVATISNADQEDINPHNNTDEVPILINLTNTAPDCETDYITVTCESVNINVLANDSDIDGDSIFICDYSAITHGTIELIDNNFVYTPPYEEFNGSVEFNYTICDIHNAQCTNTVIIQIDCDINEAPICTDDIFESNCDVISLPVLLNDYDTDGDEIVICEYSLPTHGVISETEIGFVYTPYGAYEGNDSFNYTVCDLEGEECTSTVTIQVNCVNIECETPPIYTCVDPVTPLIICPDWCFGDEVDITEMETTFNCSLQEVGEGCIRYTSLPLFTGSEEVEITACADGHCETVIAYIEVGGCCEPEPIYECTEPLTPIVICPEWCLGENIDLTEIHSTFDCSLVDLGNDCFRYTPLPLFTGQDSISVIACDAYGNCEDNMVYVEVGECGDILPPPPPPPPVEENEPPIAINDFDSSDGSPIIIPVILNDSDPDGEEVYVCDFTQPLNGTIVLNDNEFTYTPNEGFEGIDAFTYTVCDENGASDEATVTITVEHIDVDCNPNQTVCVPPFVNPSEPTLICVEFCTLGEGVHLQSLTSSSTSCSIEPQGTNCFSILPVPLFEGEITVSLTACDENYVCETAEIIVTVGDCSNVAVNELEAIDDERFGQELERMDLINCQPSIPNPITPNGSFAQSLKVIVGEQCTEDVQKAQLLVHDTNGRLLYEQESQVISELNWNAKVNNEIVPTGIYVYELKFHTEYGIQRHTGLIQVAQ